MKLRNIAIIAHVDHGKTTLIDGLFKQTGTFKAHQEVDERVMDSGQLEKERGITITAKNASLSWKDHRINIIDTPGHADFGGEVERALYMVDGAILLVDAAEGPLPQTRFVLQKAFEQNIKIIVLINKMDRPDARVAEVEQMVLELFYDLAINDEQVEYKTLYASAKSGWASLHSDTQGKDFSDLLDTIISEVPPPQVKPNLPLQVLVASRSFNSFLGQISIGKIESGSVKVGANLHLIDGKNNYNGFRVSSLQRYEGLGLKEVDQLQAGEIALISGYESPNIGDTIVSNEETKALARLVVDPPCVSVRVSVNTSPFAGQEGEYVTSRKLRELLDKICLENVAIQLEETDVKEVIIIKGRGELQIVVELEKLRRAGYEFMVGRPEIIAIEKNGSLVEPVEQMVVDLPDNFVGAVTELLSKRGGKMEMMSQMEGSSRVRLEFSIPSRGLIGIRSVLLTKTKGEAIFSSSLKDYIPYQGKRFSRQNGALVSDRTGKTVEYGLFHLQDRGKLFLPPGVPIYEGMIFGEFNKTNDLNANPTKEKKLSNMRASGKDESTKLPPCKKLDFESSLEWIDDDEWVEVTPKNIRIRKDELRTQYRKVIRK